jgi:hypothetical protein
MKFRITFFPPAEQRDYAGVLKELHRREVSKADSNYAKKFKRDVAKSKWLKPVASTILTTPGLDNILSGKVVVWKVLMAEWPHIEYYYDTEPVSLSTLPGFVKRKIVREHEKMVDKSRKAAGLMEGCVRFEVLERT